MCAEIFSRIQLFLLFCRSSAWKLYETERRHRISGLLINAADEAESRELSGSRLFKLDQFILSLDAFKDLEIKKTHQLTLNSHQLYMHYKLLILGCDYKELKIIWI